MKTWKSLLATAFLAICLLHPLGAASSDEISDKMLDKMADEIIAREAALSPAQQQRRRQILRYTLMVEECTHHTFSECKDIIENLIVTNPRIFMEKDLRYEVKKLQQPGDPNYHYVGLMTNKAGTHVAGHDGDGVVKFYNPDYSREPIWCTSSEPCPDNHNRLLHIQDKCCFNIGPWDCDTGIPKTVEECCNMVKASVPLPDMFGNMIECHVAYPVGSDNNPIDYHRVTILLDGNDSIVLPPAIE